jgi:preprotein translocase subunit SecF
MATKDQDTRDKRDDEFYEAMPLAQGQHYVYRDDTFVEANSADEAANQRLTAIITLVLVLVLAVALGFLFARGLQMMHDNLVPDNSSFSGTQL